MGSKPSEVDRNILVIADTHCKAISSFLVEQYHQLQEDSRVKLFSLRKYDEGASVVIDENEEKMLGRIDLVIVVGENKELFKAFSLFRSRDSPPIFGLGETKDYSSPLLYNYTRQHAELIKHLVFDEPKWNNLNTDNLMKLSLSVDCVKVAEITSQMEIHRAMEHAVVVLNIYIENSCEKERIKIGQFKGDGLLISTPLGSFSKSMALNGALMSRTMENITITPICPLSMKFRPLCLPASTTIFLEIDKSSRSEYVDMFLDENTRHLQLRKDQLLKVRMSKYKTRMISNLIETSEQFFIRSLQSSLRWGSSYQNVEIPKEKMMRRMSTISKSEQIQIMPETEQQRQ